MAYTALYRKYRPLTFDDVVGQKNVTETLKNEIQCGRIGHAYLFCGIRGTGKTSAARILSRAINCKNPENGNPCNKCENCRGILDGSILDITEIDAASNNGVENIRSLREEARFTGSVLAERVYIIDEVHMLSPSAFNALLKILEEPPAHVHFILATTEAQKIPATILSRCQRFDFKRITVSDIEYQINKILAESDVKIDREAVHLIADAADGSMRDALSILDQCISIGTSSVSYDDVKEFLGVADEEYINRIISCIADNDTGGIFDVVSDIADNGKSIPPIASSLLRALRNMMTDKYSGKKNETADLFTPQRLLYLVKSASEIPVLLRASSDMRLTFELSLVKLSDPSYDESYESIAARLAELEKKVKTGAVVPVPAKSAPSETEKSGKREKKVTAKPDSKPVSEEDKILKESFMALSDSLAQANHLDAYMALQQTTPSAENGKLILTFASSYEYETFKKYIDTDRETIIAMLEEITGLKADFELRYENSSVHEQSDELKKLYNNNKDIIE